jgi:hypothetical protein
MYYICRFSNNWSVYDAGRNTSRQLEPEEITCLQKLFGPLVNDQTKILTAIKVESISPNKLLQLPGIDKK